MKIMNTKLAFSVDSTTNRPVIQVINQDNGDLIRQIPPEEMLRVSQRIHDVLGILFDERG
jgi:flagellar protein FlaG